MGVKRERIEKGRAPYRRRSAEVHADTRTQRERQRGQEARASVVRELEELAGELEEILKEAQ